MRVAAMPGALAGSRGVGRLGIPTRSWRVATLGFGGRAPHAPDGAAFSTTASRWYRSSAS